MSEHESSEYVLPELPEGVVTPELMERVTAAMKAAWDATDWAIRRQAGESHKRRVYAEAVIKALKGQGWEEHRHVEARDSENRLWCASCGEYLGRNS